MKTSLFFVKGIRGLGRDLVWVDIEFLFNNSPYVNALFMFAVLNHIFLLQSCRFAKKTSNFQDEEVVVDNLCHFQRIQMLVALFSPLSDIVYCICFLD